ncbi:Maltose fermentation regulatory protein MAL13 [Fusarium oxysporum f. sp. albedinis]|nr:Maltose fermentation regulatory protein MAL13 [Fusarium oxysporum f. sp. albedinis]
MHIACKRRKPSPRPQQPNVEVGLIRSRDIIIVRLQLSVSTDAIDKHTAAYLETGGQKKLRQSSGSCGAVDVDPAPLIDNWPVCNEMAENGKCSYNQTKPLQ